MNYGFIMHLEQVNINHISKVDSKISSVLGKECLNRHRIRV